MENFAVKTVTEALEEGRRIAIVEYAKAYDFEPRWSIRDSFIYALVCAFMFLMVLVAL